MSEIRVATTAALLAVGAAGAALAGRDLLRRQAAQARGRVGGQLSQDAPSADRVWRRKLGGEPLHLVLLGDSIAAGLGAERRKQTLGGRLAKGLAASAERPVRLHTAAVVGSEASSLRGQVERLPAEWTPDIAVIVVGSNDVTHRVPVSESVAHLTEAIATLRERGACVVVGTCPDLGALREAAQPWRAVASGASRQLAAGQARAAARGGAVAVSLHRVVGPVFRARPDEMFSVDGFHPSALGYRRTAEALLPAVCAPFTPSRSAADCG